MESISLELSERIKEVQESQATYKQLLHECTGVPPALLDETKNLSDSDIIKRSIKILSNYIYGSKKFKSYSR